MMFIMIIMCTNLIFHTCMIRSHFGYPEEVAYQSQPCCCLARATLSHALRRTAAAKRAAAKPAPKKAVAKRAAARKGVAPPVAAVAVSVLPT